MKLVVISGVSGSGKSTALNALEDLGYYCIDNLPVGLIPAFAEQIQSASHDRVERVAVGVDARNLPSELHRFPYIHGQLRNKGIVSEVIFLDADNDILLKRFSETRRKHPLGMDSLPLLEAIQKERDLLQPIAERADLYIDTSRTNLHELRDLVKQRLDSGDDEDSLSILFESFGFKHGPPADADFVFDVRCLPNPHWEPKLRDYTGLDEPVVEFLQKQPQVEDMFIHIKDFMESWIPHFAADNRSYLTIAIGCTGGHHRSVYLAQRLGDAFRHHYKNVSIRHRDLS